jgi:dihydroxyacetone kinase-like protein
VQDVKNILKKLSEVFEDNRDRLNDLDTKLGDGDHGRSMALGFSAVASYIEENQPATIREVLRDGGMQFNEAAGSTIGILMFSAMREAGKAAAEREQVGLEDLKGMLVGAIEGIKKRGKAQVGQKTILDSLHPALMALEEGLKDPESDKSLLVQSMIDAASEGAESTRQMKPTIGRAKWFAERSESEIDPGAVSGALIIETLGNYLLS